MVRRQKDVKILYGLVLISTLIKSVLLENASDNYSLSNDIDLYFEKIFDKEQLYKKFFTCNFKGCSSWKIEL